MTFLVERLAELRRHLDHLRMLRPRVRGAESLDRDLSLHNDVLFSLFTVCQLVIDIAGELAARRGTWSRPRPDPPARSAVPPDQRGTRDGGVPADASAPPQARRTTQPATAV